MCGRFAQFSDAATLIRVFGLVDVPADLRPRFNVAPTQPVAAVRIHGDAERVLRLFRWGLIPHWAKDPAIGNRMINARAETIAEKPAFRSACRRRRCLIPADGFYEWRKLRQGKRPYFIRRRDHVPLALAGLWERWNDERGEPIDTCTIITTEANAALRPLHHRMPAILSPDRFEAWLDPEWKNIETLRAWLAPYAGDDLECYPVSKRVNNPEQDDPSLIEPDTESPDL